MKITGGEHKGRSLSYPKAIRPTSDKVREAIFGVLGERVRGAAILDLYAGSGALGIEALSRGAAHLVSVDKSPSSVASIQKNLTSLQLKAGVERVDIAQFVRDNPRRFDIIFADPPYEEIDWKVIDLAAKLLNVDGLLVVEYAARVLPPPYLEAAHEIDRRSYGDTGVSYFSPEADSSG